MADPTNKPTDPAAPDQTLPGAPGGVPDNELPDSGGVPDNELPDSGARPDNELPDRERGDRDLGDPDRNVNPDLDPDVERRRREGRAEPK